VYAIDHFRELVDILFGSKPAIAVEKRRLEEITADGEHEHDFAAIK
jgi:hypothetical protein